MCPLVAEGHRYGHLAVYTLVDIVFFLSIAPKSGIQPWGTMETNGQQKAWLWVAGSLQTSGTGHARSLMTGITPLSVLGVETHVEVMRDS